MIKLRHKTKAEDKNMEIREEFIKQIQECRWLQSCGTAEDLGFEVTYIKPQSKAEKKLCSLSWENICLEAYGDFSSYLCKNHKADFNKYWNETVKKIKQEYINPMSATLENAVSGFNAKENILNNIRFNLVMLFMAEFYSEYYRCDFFDNMLKIYLSGHLPCGWSGRYPNGMFYVY